MSIDATRATWKLSKDKITAVQKIILLSLADRAGENGECWPSIRRMIADTLLDRKTLIENRQELIEKGLVEYTGHMRGSTKSIPVMRLTYVIQREDEDYNNFSPSSPKNGTAQNLSSTENGTGKQSQKRDTEPKRIEPKINNNINNNFDNENEREVIISKDIDRLILTHRKSDGETSDEEFLRWVKYFIENGDSKYHLEQRIYGAIKLIKSGRFFKPAGYVSQEESRTKEILRDYLEYVSRAKADIKLNILPSDFIILEYQDWVAQIDAH